MLKLKKTAIAVLALGSSAVFAGTMGPVCAPGNVTVPCERTAWDFGAQALYLEPSLAGSGYVGSTVTGTNERYNNPGLRWGWGFMIEGSYHFNTGNDLNLNWYHWNRSSHHDFANGLTTIDAAYVGDVDFNVKPKWDAVNLEFGQHVDFGDARFVRFHGGVQYARIQLQGNLSANGYQVVGLSGVPGALVSTPIANSSKMTYNGFGPRVGADLNYGFGNGLGIYAKAASALLVGQRSFDVDSNVAILSVTSGFTGISGSQNQVVPEVEAKLGATYTYTMAQGDVSLDLGWMWLNYFNAEHIGLGGGVTQEINFALQGPFVGLKWVGNVA